MLRTHSSILPEPSFSSAARPLHTAERAPSPQKDVALASKGLRRLFCAAVVSNEFCQRLLDAPAQALEAGYNGEHFDLSPRERAEVLSLQASSLTDFAQQLLHRLGQSPISQENTAYHDTVYRVTQGGD